MQPASFDQANVILNAPQGMSPEECEPLNVFRGNSADGKPVVISCWKVTQEELEEIKKTGRIWLWVYGETMPPCAVDGKFPFPSDVSDKISKG